MPPQQHYHLKIAELPAELLSVESFTLRESLGRPFAADIRVTSARQDIDLVSLLDRYALFSIHGPHPDATLFPETPPQLLRRWRGVVSHARRLSASRDEALYELRIESQLARLGEGRYSRIFQHQSVPDIIEAVLRRHDYRGHEITWKLRPLFGQDHNPYPKLEYVTQYQESDLDFIHRLAEKAGLYYYLVTDPKSAAWETIVFGDDVDAYVRTGRDPAQPPQGGVKLKLRPQAGMADNEETLSRFELAAQPIRAQIQRKDYNYRDANQPLLAEGGPPANTPGARGVDYLWGEHYKDPAQGQRAVLIAQQREHCRQWIAAGDGNCLQAFAPGQIFKHDGPALAPAPDGWLLVSVQHQGGRRDAYRNAFTATPADRPYRQELSTAVPNITGALPSRIVAPEKTHYGAIDLQGRYCVRLPFDLDEWSPGGDSRPLRLARPYAGPEYGQHFPLHQGTEVLVSFVLGDVDRPYISGCLHNSELTDSNPGAHWDSRNLIRTWANNKLRLEDRQGQEHIKLATEYDKSQLNLGHLVNGQRAPRGQGFELRTDGWGALRAAKGLFLSTDAQPKAGGKQLDMQAAQADLDSALSNMQTLADMAAQARALAADIEQQRQLMADRLSELQKSTLLAHAPDGIGLSSGQHLQLAAGGNLIATAGGHADIGAIKRFTVAAGEALSLFAHRLGAKLIAAQGKVEIQAQHDAIELAALKQIRIISSGDEIIIAANKKLTLQCGGSYLTLDSCKVEAGTRGDIKLHGASLTAPGPASMPTPAYDFPSAKVVEPRDHYFTLNNPASGKPHAGMPYTITEPDGVIHRCQTDGSGKTQTIKSSYAKSQLKIVFEPQGE
ncbi:type VI secretion system Vgr family protein [Chromobacterium haemolyticum]|uniref:type VI secretion system Vgr family protein n=2 Tax=Chromobacterium haemolyticum TaxID=394935 RepID=UPI001317EFB6|nr:type VI secretion system Vgr family protein [Chromobacterium haemolyticum]BBH12435.1 type IV secretion protein Rhs [Chromobacterium haemolyticum]